jgi:DNA polymerase IV
MQKHDPKSNTDNPNKRTIDVLQQMLDYYTRTDDQWRMLAYRKGISALRRQPKKIVTRAQAIAIPGIGPRLADKIEEIVVTNRLRRLENANTTPEDLILQEFLGIYGAGIVQASRWLAQGYRSLEDLKTKASLSPQQRIGIDRYYDFSQRIPREEVETHGEIVRKAVQKVDQGMQVIISGSYRRGAADSGDIDLLITKADATIEQIRTLMIDVVVPKLFKQGFLQIGLAVTSRVDGSKWHGASLVPGSHVWRRIDLLFVPGSEIGAALIYFTGSDIFNRSMRLLASKKGMRLNQRGLYTDVLRGPQRVKLNPGRLLEGRDERRIFEILGVPWRPPEHRIC